MAALPWAPGAVMGRVGNLRWSLDKIEALFKVLHLAVTQEEIREKNSDEESAVLFVMRMGREACDSIREELKCLDDMALEQNSREVAAKKEG